MKTLNCTSILAVVVSFGAVALVASPSAASGPVALLVAPQPDPCLPKFGFSSFNIAGVGERVTYVQWGGLASRLGLEPGDLILSLNGYPLTYHGSWSDSLSRAAANGGIVRLRIRDVRSGLVAVRQTYLGDGLGPVTPKYHVAGVIGPVPAHRIHREHAAGHPHGPATAKSHAGPAHASDVHGRLKQIAMLFDN